MHKVLYIPFVLMLLCLVSCFNDEEYSASPSDILAFSVDTMDMDTVIAGAPSHTYRFSVYNHASKALRIPTIALEGGSESRFFVNVNGTELNGGSGTDFEIGAKDSLQVFLMVNPKEQDLDDPVKITDALRFTTEGGAVGRVVLMAHSQDVVTMQAPVITSDEIWDAKRPYRIIDSLEIKAGAKLTLCEGVRLYFHPKAELIVHGCLTANGSFEHPITMRGDRLGNMFSAQPYDRIPGQWGGVRFEQDSHNNYLNYCDIHSASYGIICNDNDDTLPKLTIENSIIHNVTTDALQATMSNIFVGNTQITNAGRNCVSLFGGDNSFVHCTIGRFYAITGAIGGVALTFQNYLDAQSPAPMHRAAFANCLITGYGADEIMGDQSKDMPETAFAYGFQNCVIRTPKVEDGGFENCYFEDEGDIKGADHFSPAFDLDKLLYFFTLSPESPAVGRADREISSYFYPLDRLGRPRIKSEKSPDAGCYETAKE